jgi:hypothetical protein
VRSFCLAARCGRFEVVVAPSLCLLQTIFGRHRQVHNCMLPMIFLNMLALSPALSLLLSLQIAAVRRSDVRSVPHQCFSRVLQICAAKVFAARGPATGDPIGMNTGGINGSI